MIEIQKTYLIKNYEIFKGEELKIADLIQRRRYQLLVHSCIYYYLHDNIVEDFQWDSWARELVDLQERYPEISKQVVLYEYFKDWDAVTGMCLPITLDWVIALANRLLNNCGRKISQPKVVKPIKSANKVDKSNVKKRRLF